MMNTNAFLNVTNNNPQQFSQSNPDLSAISNLNNDQSNQDNLMRNPGSDIDLTALYNNTPGFSQSVPNNNMLSLPVNINQNQMMVHMNPMQQTPARMAPMPPMASMAPVAPVAAMAAMAAMAPAPARSAPSVPVVPVHNIVTPQITVTPGPFQQGKTFVPYRER